jgi:hypothetical protein
MSTLRVAQKLDETPGGRKRRFRDSAALIELARYGHATCSGGMMKPAETTTYTQVLLRYSGTCPLLERGNVDTTRWG